MKISIRFIRIKSLNEKNYFISLYITREVPVTVTRRSPHFTRMLLLENDDTVDLCEWILNSCYINYILNRIPFVTI